jgi:uncharacterized protein (DUF1778 family)
MNLEMKTKHLGIRVDEKTKDLLEEAHSLSGIPVSEITRKGALAEAVKIISMFSDTLRHVKTRGQTKKKLEAL